MIIETELISKVTILTHKLEMLVIHSEAREKVPRVLKNLNKVESKKKAHRAIAIIIRANNLHSTLDLDP